MTKRPAATRTGTLYIIGLVAGVIGVFSAGCSSCGKKTPAADGQPLAPGAAITVPAARPAYVTNNGSDTISVLDRDDPARVQNVPIDIDPDEHEAPHHLAIDGASKHVFVALAFPPAPSDTKKKDPHGSHGGSADNGELVRMDLDNLSVTAETDVDENPGDVVLTHDRTKVLVSHFDMRRAMEVAAKGGASPSTMFAQLIVLDAKTMKRLDARAICTAPHGVTTTKDDKTAFIACYGSDELAVVDLGPGLATSRIPLGSAPGVPGVPRYGPYSATLSPDETTVIVADLEGQDIRVFDRATKKFVAEKTVPLAAKAFMPAFVDAHTLLVPTQAPDGLVKIDVEGGKVVARGAITKAECTLPHVVKVAKDGRIFMVCEGDHTGPGSVVELDAASLAVKKRWQVGVYPDGIALPED